MRYPMRIRRRAADYFEQGRSGDTLRKSSVCPKRRGKWGYSYQALGRQAFLKGNPKTYSYTKIKDNQGNYVTRKPVVVLVTDGEPQQFMSENW